MRRLLFLCLALFSSSAFAIDFYYPLGHREAIMGGNTVAMVGSPVGLIFNPSELGTLESPSFSLSGSSYFITKADSPNLHYSSFTSIPNTVISSWQVGNGSLAIGLIVPKAQDAEVSESLPASAVVTGLPATDTVDVRVSALTNRTLAGAGWGERYGSCGDGCDVYVGGSIFLSYDESRKNAFLSYSPVSNAAAFAIQSSSRSTVTSALAVLGGLWRKGNESALGVRLELPSILLRDSIEGNQTALVYNQTSTPPITTAKSPASDTLPALDSWLLSVGGWWPKLLDRWTFVANAELGDRPRSLSSNDTQVSTVALSGGARYQLTEKYALHGGTRVAFPSIVSGDPDHDYRYWNVLLTAGLTWLTKDLETSAGVFDVQNIVRSEPPAANKTAFDINPSSVQYYGLMLSAQYKF